MGLTPYHGGGVPAERVKLISTVALEMSLTAQSPQPTLAWQFENSNVDSVTGLSPDLSTTGTYAAPTGGTITTVAGKRIHKPKHSIDELLIFMKAVLAMSRLSDP
jgi:hypothetical protein